MPLVEVGEILPLSRSTFHALRTSRNRSGLVPLSTRTTAKTFSNTFVRSGLHLVHNAQPHFDRQISNTSVTRNGMFVAPGLRGKAHSISTRWAPSARKEPCQKPNPPENRRLRRSEPGMSSDPSKVSSD